MIDDCLKLIWTRPGRAERIGLRQLTLVVLAAVLLASCSTVESVIGSDDPQPARVSDDSSADDQPYPNLGSVPDKPPAISPETLRQRTLQGLAADRANAQYSGETLTATSVAVPPAPPPPPAPKPAVIPESPPDLTPVEGEASSEPSASSAEQQEQEEGQSTPPVPEEAEELEAQPVEPVESETLAESDTPPAEEGATETTEPEAEVDDGLAAAAERRKSAQESLKEAEEQAASEAQSQQGEAELQAEPEVEPQAKQAPAVEPAQAAKSETQVASAPVRPQPAESTLVGVIFFGLGSAQLNNQDREVLKQIVDLQAETGGVIRVVGHASSQGGGRDLVEQLQANFEMSLQRANAVADELRRLGVIDAALLVEAKGDLEPVYQETGNTGRAGNRRAEVFLE